MPSKRAREIAGLKWEYVTDTELKIDYSEHRLDYDDKACEYYIGGISYVRRCEDAGIDKRVQLPVD